MSNLVLLERQQPALNARTHSARRPARPSMATYRMTRRSVLIGAVASPPALLRAFRYSRLSTALTTRNLTRSALFYLLAAWREAPCYTDRERAALGWTDALTRLSEGRELDGARQALQAHFTESEQIKLTLMINVINGWNRIAVGFGLFADPAAIKAVAAKAAAA